jgi:prepilin-type N-terminal cleavage/methylation domain-containing protein
VKRSPPPSPAAGFSLVEIMVAMLILSLTALSLAPLMLRASQTGKSAEAMLYEQAVLSTEVGRLNALSWDSLSTGTTCLTTSASPLPHTRCTTVTSVTSKLYRVMVRVTPSDSARLKPDTVTFDRTYTSTYNPLNSP